MRIRNFVAAAILGVAALGLSGCATGLPTKVTRYSTAIQQGQSFYVVPAEGIQSGLEFNSYAGIVAQQLAARGYRQAPSTAAADMLVRVGYGVDEGRQEVYVDPAARDPFFYGGGREITNTHDTPRFPKTLWVRALIVSSVLNCR